MYFWIAILLTALVVITVVTAALYYFRAPADTVVEEVPRQSPVADWSAARQAAEERGTELLDRRIALDDRRGPLQGNAWIDDAMAALEQRRDRGEISESEFESEKIKLLGG
jgi:hypothetical protein